MFCKWANRASHTNDEENYCLFKILVARIEILALRSSKPLWIRSILFVVWCCFHHGKHKSRLLR